MRDSEFKHFAYVDGKFLVSKKIVVRVKRTPITKRVKAVSQKGK